MSGRQRARTDAPAGAGGTSGPRCPASALRRGASGRDGRACALLWWRPGAPGQRGDPKRQRAFPPVARSYPGNQLDSTRRTRREKGNRVGLGGRPAGPRGVQCHKAFLHLSSRTSPFSPSFLPVFLFAWGFVGFLKSIKKFSSSNTLIFFNPHLLSPLTSPPARQLFTFPTRAPQTCPFLPAFVASTRQTATRVPRE